MIELFPNLGDIMNFLNDKNPTHVEIQKTILYFENIFGQTNIRLVGGCVRDIVMGNTVSDLDFATKHTPERVMEICKNFDLSFVPTGLEHGTVTVVVNDIPYEVTSLRKDVATDGRRAVIEYTTDWKEDSLRRDFTCNAMYMDSTGFLYDYNNGLKDIHDGMIRFVGKAPERIAEDYLRIIRFIRFISNFDFNYTEDDFQVCAELSRNLDKISVERIWSEFKKLRNDHRKVSRFLNLLSLMRVDYNFPTTVVVPDTDDNRILFSPICAFVNHFNSVEEVVVFSSRMKLSMEEQETLEFFVMNRDLVLGNLIQYNKNCNKVFNKFLKNERQLNLLNIRMRMLSRTILGYNLQMVLSVFPVSGRDLLDLGVKEGKVMGNILNDLYELWESNGCLSSKSELLERILVDCT